MTIGASGSLSNRWMSSPRGTDVTRVCRSEPTFGAPTVFCTAHPLLRQRRAGQRALSLSDRCLGFRSVATVGWSYRGGTVTPSRRKDPTVVAVGSDRMGSGDPAGRRRFIRFGGCGCPWPAPCCDRRCGDRGLHALGSEGGGLHGHRTSGVHDRGVPGQPVQG